MGRIWPLTTIITLSWKSHFEKKTQNMSYKNAQLRRTVPTCQNWETNGLLCSLTNGQQKAQFLPENERENYHEKFGGAGGEGGLALD